MSKTKKWTEEEDKRLLALRKRNVPFKALPEFFEGRTQDAIRNRAWVLKETQSNGWIDDEVVAAFDIETTDLKADVGFMMSWAIYYADGTVKSDRIKRREILNGKLDERIMKSFLKEIQNVDVLIGYYSTKFDVPYVRTRAEILGLDFPTYGQIKHLDLYYMVRAKLQLRNNRLATACEALGLEEKTHEPIGVWNDARRGVQSAIDKLWKYNENDSKITFLLWERMKKYRKVTRKSI